MIEGEGSLTLLSREGVKMSGGGECPSAYSLREALTLTARLNITPHKKRNPVEITRALLASERLEWVPLRNAHTFVTQCAQGLRAYTPSTMKRNLRW
jgi:hypothetical protein